MAAWADLAARLAAIQDAGLVTAADYQGKPSRWLVTALDGVDVRVINCKGTSPGATLCLVRLITLEKLLAAAQEPTIPTSLT